MSEFADAGEAGNYIMEHDHDVKILHRKTVPTLRGIWRTEMAARGITAIYGGPVSHDELVSAIADMRFPRVAEARVVYYAGHTYTPTWQATPHEP